MKLCWNITNVCNASCNHCFRNCDEQPISLEKNMQILKNMKGIVDGISFSGGEALLYEGFLDLLAAAKSMGYSCSLTTNGILLNSSNIADVIKNLDRITFSIDSTNDEKNMAIGRGYNHCKHLQEVISIIKRTKKDFPIKVNTVVTKENISEIEQVYNFLKTQKISSWKLMRFCPYRQIAKSNAQRLAISDQDYFKIKELSNTFTDINVTAEDINEIEEQLFISARGDLCIGKNNEDVILLPDLHTQSKEAINSAIEARMGSDSQLNINLNLYKTFYLVAKAGSISAASKQSYISQPALSKSIKKIETDLNVKLFDRTINGVVLTKEGEKLLYHIEAAFNNILTAERSLKERDSFAKGYLKIGTPSHIGTFFIFDAVKEFRKRYPHIKISIISRSTKELLDMLSKHDIDFVIDAAPIISEDKSLTIVPLRKARHCFVCHISQKPIYENVVSVFDLQTKPLLLPVAHSSHRKNLNSICDSVGATLTNVLGIETSEMLINAVHQNLGVGYVLYDLVKDDIDDGLLSEVKIKEKLPEIELDLVYYEDYLTAVPRHFIQEFILCHNQKL